MGAIAIEYKNKYDVDLASDLREDTSGGLEDLLLELASRDQGSAVDQHLAEQEAKLLYKVGIVLTILGDILHFFIIQGKIFTTLASCFQVSERSMFYPRDSNERHFYTHRILI